MSGIYLHIPFCKRKCIYCDFYSTTESKWRADFVQALCKEIAYRKDYLAGQPVRSIYFGGGTPSQLTEEDFRVIFHTLQSNYTWVEDIEITIEANPDDLNADYLNMLSAFPFNRLSMGVQTFHDHHLQRLNRRHTARQAIDAYHRCRGMGWKNISLDLMYGLPEETEEEWQADLAQIISLRPEHISAYHLIYEEGTPLWEKRKEKKVIEIPEEKSVTFFSLLIDELTKAGYEQYEISNFSLPDKHSRHNSSYWEGLHYLGCGPSAHSYNGVSRLWNVSDVERYIAGVHTPPMAQEWEELDFYTRYNERIITSVRTMKGLYLPALQADFGTELYHYCLRMATAAVKAGHLEIKEEYLRLTRAGIFLSDAVMSDLLWV